MRQGLVVILLLSFLPFLPAIGAQAALPVYSFSMVAPTGLTEVKLGFLGHATFTFVDDSRDTPSAFVPGGPPVPVLFHQVDFKVTAGFADSDGWLLTPPTGFTSSSGQRHDVTIQVLPSFQATNPYFQAHVNATIKTQDGGVFYRETDLLFFTKGLPGFSVSFVSAVRIAPKQVISDSIELRNIGVFPRTFESEITRNACNLGIVRPATFVVPARSKAIVMFSVRGPTDQFLYLGDSCSVEMAFWPADNPDIRITTVLPVTVAGTYVNPVAVFDFFALVLLVFLFILFLKRRKERLEEEILGKPQKPWLIPVEKVYLRHLKAKDQRAWYVVRHYLMEDEYRSSLMWYKAYKSATRGDRKKERLVLGEEKTYARWKAAWAKDIAKPIRKADRLEAKLQRKLDRKARKAHRKATRKWRKSVKKIEAKHEAKADKEAALHAKLLARARKKGLPMPAQPSLPPPDLPDEPTLQARPLADHRWAKKEARFRRRMLKTQGDLEVKFEKADARRRLQLKRKVQKLARKLGDADFVAHHVSQD